MNSTDRVACPACGHRNFAGEDQCQRCGSALSDLSKPRGATRIERSIHKIRVRALNPRLPLTVPPQAAVGEVLRLLVEHSVGCVVVVDEESRPVGIFSERDALQRLNVDYQSMLARPVRDFMTEKVEMLSLDDKLAVALHAMDLGGYRHLPIAADGVVVGIISVRDILRYLTDELLAQEA